jgi:hypothetical protein
MIQDDPVVRRVREARRQIAERHGQDARALYEWAKQVEKQHLERVVGYERTGQCGTQSETPH